MPHKNLIPAALTGTPAAAPRRFGTSNLRFAAVSTLSDETYAIFSFEYQARDYCTHELSAGAVLDLQTGQYTQITDV